jgi:ABC-type lipoprotein release transport system permease subunit
MTSWRKPVLVGLGGLALVMVFWKGVLGLFMLVGALLAAVVVVSLLASVAAVVVALLPVPKVPVRYNLRNLQVRWRTTAVTALAFTLVIALLTVMLAFVQGMYRLTEESGQPANIIVLSDGATDEAFSNLPGNVSVMLLPADFQEMVERDADGKHWAVKEVYIIVTHMLPNPQPGGRQRRFVQMRGVDDPIMAAKIHGIELEKGGTWFSSSGVRPIAPGSKETAYEVVIGDGVAKAFGADKGEAAVGPGEVLEMGGRKWYVVGVMKPSASTFGSEIWAKDTYIAENFGRVNSYSSYVVRVKDAKLASTAVELVKKHRAEQAFQAYTEPEYYSKLSETNQQFLVAVIFIGIIMAFGGVLGVMNTMFAAISQRSKDIGVLRLLGFTRWQVLFSFLLESVVISFLGGLLGCAIGYLADGWTATSIVQSSGGGGKSVVLKLAVDPFTLGVALLFTLVMGAVGGLIPSLFSMRLRPLESLR